jgi:hypothetical protein
MCKKLIGVKKSISGLKKRDKIILEYLPRNKITLQYVPKQNYIKIRS